MDISKWGCAISNRVSDAAAIELAASPGPGVLWLVTEAVAYHDDPAGATLSWQLYGDSAQTITLPVGVTAINTRVRLGAIYPALPLLMPGSFYLKILAAANLAAGKKFYLEFYYHFLRGIPAGAYS